MGWNPGCDGVGGKTPTDFRQVWVSPIAFLNVRAAAEYQSPLQPPRPVWVQWPLQSTNPVPSRLTRCCEQVGGLPINVSPKMGQTGKSDNLEQLLSYSAWWGAAGTLLKAFENKNTSSLLRLGDSLSCVKSLLTTQWHLKGTDRRDARHRDTLKGITKGSETQAINQSIHTVTEQCHGTAFARIQRLGKC